MGSCFSSQKQGQVLGSGPPSAGQTPVPQPGAPPQGSTMGGGNERPDDPRAAALRAAEARQQAAGSRGVSPTNAKSGQLSQKLAMERRTSSSANTKGNPNDRMMDAGQWN